MAIVEDDSRISFNNMIVLVSLLILVAASAFLGAKSPTQGSGIVLKGLTLGENIGNEFPAITEHEWTPLKGGTIYTGQGRTDYKQYLRFTGGTSADPIESGSAVYGENNEGEVGPFLKFNQGDDMFEYEIQFQSGLESRIENGKLIDLDGEQIRILGSSFTITDTSINTANNRVSLRLIGGGKTLFLREGATDVFTVGDKRFVVSITGVFDESRRPRAVVRFNNMQSDTIEEGEIDYLPDGTAVGIVEILPNEGAEEGGQDMVELTLGASRVEFEDTYNDNSFENRVEVSGQSIPEGRVMIKGTVNGDIFKISSIIYRLEARGKRGGDVYVGVGSSLSSQIAKPGGLLTYDFDLFFGGLGYEVSQATAPRSYAQAGGSGTAIVFRGRDDRYTWAFTNSRGQQYLVPIAYNSQSTGFRAGDRNGELHFSESGSDVDFIIQPNDMFVTTNRNSDLGDTNVFRYTGVNPTSKSVKFEDLALGSRTVQLQDDPNPAILGRGQLIASGVPYELTVSNTAPYAIAIDLTSDNDFNGDDPDVVVFGGGRFEVNVGGASIGFTLVTDERKIDEATTDEEVEFDIVATSGNEVDLEIDPGQTDLTLETLKGGRRQGMSRRYGALFIFQNNGEGDANDLAIEYPTRQRIAGVSVVS